MVSIPFDLPKPQPLPPWMAEQAARIAEAEKEYQMRNAEQPKPKRAHSHYFKSCPYSYVDVYRVLELFGVSDPCLQHAIKKLLVAGGRGNKDSAQDVEEAIASLTRWQEMRIEERDALNER